MIQEELDSEAAGKLPKGNQFPLNEFQFKATVNDILRILDNLKKMAKETKKEEEKKSEADKVDKKEKKFKIERIKAGDASVAPRVTVWFNAWKYESTQQLWAGLADSIVKQIVGRLERKEDVEKFLFNLHLRRQNIDKIRQKIYNEILSSWWEKTRPWMMGFIPAIGISAIMSIISAESIRSGLDSSIEDVIGVSGLGVLIASVTGVIITSIRNYLDVKSESAKMVAGEFLDIPDYSTNLGFIHHVEGDLQKIFDTIRDTEHSKYLPIVIFIDDLDRCSPEKIADVAEGINLFLAGGFEECIFVLGIDAEIVAAALEIAHGNIISKLPDYSLSTPVGRRFMDKFVQLPITLPLPEKENIPIYVDSLLDEKYVNINSSKEKIEQLNQEIDRYSDEDPVIRKLIKEATSDFSDNPREMKRFMNAFRFQYFLWLTRKNRSGALKHLTKTQLQRWVTLSLKWPEVVR